MNANCEVITRVDIGSDHRMVRARVEIDKKLMRLNKIQKQKPHRSDLRVLEKLATPFRIELKNRFDTLKDEKPPIEKMNTILRESMDTIQNKTQKSTVKKSIEDTEMKNLDKKRKELRQKKKQTNKKPQPPPQKKNQQQQKTNKQNTKRQGRICRTQQISEKETQNKSTEEKKRINTGNIRSKKGSKTHRINTEINK